MKHNMYNEVFFRRRVVLASLGTPITLGHGTIILQSLL
jgi:hypothetical protein